MKIDATNGYIKSLIDAGSDAMKNLYLVEFRGGGITPISNSLMIRNSDFQPPTFTQGKEKKSFLTVDVDMPTASIEGDKSFSLTFRLDSNYKLYNFLMEQQSATMSGSEGWAINSVPDDIDSGYGLTITVKAYDGTLKNGTGTVSTGNEAGGPNDDANYKKIYEFRYCWIKSIDPISYSYDSNSPLSVKASISFMDYDDPMSLLMDNTGDDVSRVINRFIRS